jgi:hypothetical protein
MPNESIRLLTRVSIYYICLVPQYPVYRPDDNWTNRNFNDKHFNSHDWSDDYDDYYPNDDLPPNLMNIDFSTFDSSQLRPVPVSLLNSNGQLTELDVNTRTKNFQDYKQRCQLLERLSLEYNDNGYSNSSNDYYPYDNYNSNHR